VKGSFKTALIAAAVSGVVSASAAVATTQTFVLGTTDRVNAATKVTNLQSNGTTVNPVDAPLMTLENKSTSANATPLSLTAASGHAPLKVNTKTKVANLNADQLDGVDSTQFQRVGLMYWGAPPQSDVGAVVIRWNELHAEILVGSTPGTVSIVNIGAAGSQDLHVFAPGEQIGLAPGQQSANEDVDSLRPFLIASADGVRSWMVNCARDFLGNNTVIRCQGVASNVG